MEHIITLFLWIIFYSVFTFLFCYFMNREIKSPEFKKETKELNNAINIFCEKVVKQFKIDKLCKLLNSLHF